MTGFGSALRAERERRNLTLQSICDRTKVSVRNLQALEAEDFGALPSGVFRKGIARAYVLELGLDENHWIERFQVSHNDFARRSGISGPEPEAWETFAENVKRGRIQARRSLDLRWLYIILMFLALSAAAWATWRYILEPRLPSPPPVSQLPPSLSSTALENGHPPGNFRPVPKVDTDLTRLF